MKRAILAIVFLAASFYGFSQDSAGVYVPVISDTSNIITIVDVGDAHFIRKGNQCSVWGRVAVSPRNATTTRTTFSLTQPFPSAFSDYDDAIGHLTAVQGINNLTAGAVYVVPSNVVVFFWNQIFKAGTNVYYSYCYTIK